MVVTSASLDFRIPYRQAPARSIHRTAKSRFSPETLSLFAAALLLPRKPSSGGYKRVNLLK